jgi:hypothetical protein
MKLSALEPSGFSKPAAEPREKLLCPMCCKPVRNPTEHAVKDDQYSELIWTCAQIKVLHPKKPIRTPLTSVVEIFSPTKAPTNEEWELLDNKTRLTLEGKPGGWTEEEADSIQKIWREDHSWKWDALPALKAHAAMVDKQRELARLKLEQIKREEEVAKIGRIHLPCDCGEKGRWVDPSRVSYNRVLKATGSRWYIDCGVCGAQFFVDFKILERKQ